MKTYYDGEEREILGIEEHLWHPTLGTMWKVTYQRDGFVAYLLVPALDELDAMRKFPDELERLSKNHEE